MIDTFAADLQDALIAQCPTDTGFMSTNIYIYDFATYWQISIETSYANPVNYREKPRSPKEEANKHWVERTIIETAQKYGANVELEVY